MFLLRNVWRLVDWSYVLHFSLAGLKHEIVQTICLWPSSRLQDTVKMNDEWCSKMENIGKCNIIILDAVKSMMQCDVAMTPLLQKNNMFTKNIKLWNVILQKMEQKVFFFMTLNKSVVGCFELLIVKCHFAIQGREPICFILN